MAIGDKEKERRAIPRQGVTADQDPSAQSPDKKNHIKEFLARLRSHLLGYPQQPHFLSELKGAFGTERSAFIQSLRGVLQTRPIAYDFFEECAERYVTDPDYSRSEFLKNIKFVIPELEGRYIGFFADAHCPAKSAVKLRVPRSAMAAHDTPSMTANVVMLDFTRASTNLSVYLGRHNQQQYNESSFFSRVGHRLFAKGADRYVSPARRACANAAKKLIEDFLHASEQDRPRIMNELAKLRQQHVACNSRLFNGFHGDRLGVILSRLLLPDPAPQDSPDAHSRTSSVSGDDAMKMQSISGYVSLHRS